MSEDMVERVARAIDPHDWQNWDNWVGVKGYTQEEAAEEFVRSKSLQRSMDRASAAIEAMREPSDAFLALVAERMHDARFSRSGETYPVPRNFLRAVVDAALSPPIPVGENK